MAEQDKCQDIASAIADTVEKNAKDTPFCLPLAAWQTTSPASAEINAAYRAEIDAYKRAPAAPCDKTTASKLLRKFARKDFGTFWTSPVKEYLPAVSEGTMKLSETVYPHDEAVRHAKELISTLSPKELAKDFLYGVAHSVPAYCTALACYFYIKNLPEHAFEPKYVGSVVGKDRYNEKCCEICGYTHALSAEPKMQFFHINTDMAFFYLKGRVPRSSLNAAMSFLQEHKRLPHPDHTRADYEHFLKLIAVIERTPPNMTSGKLRKELKQSGLLSMTLDRIEYLINTLGYLDILHPEDSHGMLHTHTKERDMLYPLSDRGYAEHPVNRWTRRCGIDFDSISFLFDGIYEE